MSDIDKLLSEILNDRKLKNSKSCSERIYSDQPLIKRASQIKTPKTPQKIKDMKAIAYTPEAYWKTSAWLFCTQGTFMADFTDVYEYNEDFINIFPTYAGLTMPQLRGYFSWRTQIRNGENPYAPLPFVYMHAYELINNIGVSSHEKGFENLMNLLENYGEQDRDLNRCLSRWLSDYAVYYRLDLEYAKKSPEFVTDAHMLKLMHYESSADSELFSAMTALSSYKVEKSAFYIAHQDEYREAAVRIFRSMSDFFKSHRKKSLFENYFGAITQRPVRMFENAVFHDKKLTEAFVYEINELRSYKYNNGAWLCRSHNVKYRQNRHLGELLRAIDSVMREWYEYPGQIIAETTKNTEKIIRSELSAIEKEHKRKAASEVRIDLSRLSSIRADADTTRDALLTEEDFTEIENEYAIAEPISEEHYETETEISENSLLTEAETAFLNALINGGNWSETAVKTGNLPSVLADSINEKFFDDFGDTVIEFNGDIPELVEDYTEDLKQYV